MPTDICPTRNSQLFFILTTNITSVPTSFKFFIKQVYQKESTQNINKKKDQNNYFRAEISQKEAQLSRPKVKKKTHF